MRLLRRSGSRFLYNEHGLLRGRPFRPGGSASETGFIEQLDKEDRAEDRWIAAKDIVDAWSEPDAQEMIKSFVEMFKSGACHIV